jgi:hypothetical protein
VPSAATAGVIGYYVLQGVSFGTPCCNSLRDLHLSRLQTWTKVTDMRASIRVLKPRLHKEAIER